MATSTQAADIKTPESLIRAWAHFLFNTTVGAKMLMAVTGMGLWLFLVAHLAGNLTAYLGAETFNKYAAALKANPPILWFVRICLMAGFPLHIYTAIRTSKLNADARPVAYAATPKAPIGLAAKTMLISGLVVLAFFLFHLAHFTWHQVGPMPADVETNPYAMLVLGFQQKPLAILYIVGQVLLAGHLSHGLYSMFQHLGLHGKRWTPFVKTFALAVGYGLCLAFASIPLSVMFGVIKP
jgi:succinate dehydrogenase / fumarate reductase, cytochrome b subunit